MALPVDRNSLIQWCLRELGHPVIKINIDETQIEDRVDETLELFKEYHVDGTGQFFKAFKITGSTLALTAAPVGDFLLREEITGGTSGARGRFESFDSATNKITFSYPDGTSATPFVNGEIVTGTTSGASATLTAANAVTLGAMDKRYLEIDDSFVGIVDILKQRSSFGSHPINPFDLQYQLAQNVTIQTFLNADVVTYYMYQQDIQLWNQLFVGKQPFWHARKQNRLYIYANWREEFVINQYLVVQYWGAVTPADYPKVYGDKWIRKYLTAALREQWGQNLSKYNNIQLPGGTVLNGEQIREQGRADKELAYQELRSTYEMKTPFIIG